MDKLPETIKLKEYKSDKKLPHSFSEMVREVFVELPRIIKGIVIAIEKQYSEITKRVNRLLKIDVDNDGNVGIAGYLHIDYGGVNIKTYDNVDGGIFSTYDDSKSIGLSSSDVGSYGGDGSIGLKLQGGSGVTNDAWARIYSGGTALVHFDGDGNTGFNTVGPTAKVDVNSDILRLRTAKTPASAGADGNAGDICWDAGYVYVCVAADTWKRAALSAW